MLFVIQWGFNTTLQLVTADPLGYELYTSERLAPETFKLAGATVKEMIEACRGTCRAIGIKKCSKCSVPRLIKHIKEAPKLILDKQRSSARGAA